MHAMKNNPRGNRHTLLNRLALARLRTDRLFELVSWSTESFGSPPRQQHSESMALIVSFNRKLSRTRFRRSQCLPTRGHHASSSQGLAGLR